MKNDTKCLFIRSYSKDVEWLKSCLYTIEKFFSGYDEIVLCYPIGQEKYFIDLGTKLNIRKVTCPIYRNDYIGQQISKILAFQYTDCEYIMYFDSDCIFTDYMTYDNLLENGSPIIYMDKWEDLPSCVYPWKQITEKLTGYQIDYEYMRCFPFIYYRQSLVNLYNHFGADKFIQTIISNNELSEFNLIGSYIHKYDTESKYIFKLASKEYVPKNIKQYWSHDEDKNNIIKNILNNDNN